MEEELEVLGTNKDFGMGYTMVEEKFENHMHQNFEQD
jgi:hypothetical protein